MTAFPPTSAANAEELFAVGADHRARGELGKVERIELLVGVAKPALLWYH